MDIVYVHENTSRAIRLGEAGVRVVELRDRTLRIASSVAARWRPVAGGAWMIQQELLAEPKPYKKCRPLIVGYRSRVAGHVNELGTTYRGQECRRLPFLKDRHWCETAMSVPLQPE